MHVQAPLSHDLAGPSSHHDVHGRHEGHSVAMFRDRFWVSLLLTIPVLIWSPDLQMWLGSRPRPSPAPTSSRPSSGPIVFLYGGGVFLRGALASCATGSPA